jgi:hypothetical protein
MCFALSAAQSQAPKPLADEPMSVGRGWPVPVDLGAYDGYPEEQFVGSVTPWYWDIATTATGGEAPAGVTPLERDLFTSDDFYADHDLWMDPRYYRCNSPIALDSIRGDYTSGPSAVENGDPATAAWGHCERDYPRWAIVSPYPFATAEEHYAALRAEAEAKGGPTEHTSETLPDWNGRYTRNLNLAFAVGRRGEVSAGLPQAYIEPPQWVVGWANQMPTILSLLTPEYQQRFVQMYHKANTNASQFSLMFCRPEGLMRWWSGPGGPSQLDVTLVPGRVQFLGEDGRGTQVSPGTTIQYKVRDLYDRPWARIWEEYFEDGMSRPQEDDSLGGFN